MSDTGRPPLSRRLAAILFADLVGYSELAARHEDDALDRVHRLQAVAQRVVGGMGGRVVKLLGDGVMAEFPSAEQAVRSAATLLGAVGAAREGTAEIRIGIHIGEVAVREDGDLYGDGVNMAARLQAASRPGQVLVSEDVWRLLRRREGFQFEPLGERPLKGAPEPMVVYALGAVPAAGASQDSARERASARDGTDPSFGRPGWTRIAVPAAAGLLLLTALAALYRGWVTPPPIAYGSVAVLPFEHLGSDSSNPHLGVGITEEIRTSLARLGDLNVIDRASVMRYRGSPVSFHEIAEELDVATILQGRVQQVGDRVRITVQLVDARADKQIWADTYDRELEDIFALQTEVAREIARALRVRLSPGDRERLAAGQAPPDLDSHRLYLEGREFWSRRTEEDLRRAIDRFERAVARSPTYAQARLGLAESWVLLPSYGSTPPRLAFERARSEAERALLLDPGLGRAHTTLAVTLYTQDRTWDAADRSFRRAIELSPGDATVHHWYAVYLMARGRNEEALSEIRRARALDPLSLVINAEVGWVHYFGRRYDEAIAEYARARDMDPGFPLAYEFLWQVYERTGRIEEAIEAARQAAHLYDWPEAPADELAAALSRAYETAGSTGYWRERLAWAPRMGRRSTLTSPVGWASVMASAGDTEGAITTLTRAVEALDPFIIFLAVEPGLDPLRVDPRFADLVRSIGLPSPAHPNPEPQEAAT